MKRLLSIVSMFAMLLLCIPTTALAANCSSLTSTNIVTFWDFDESGGNAADATGNGNTFVNNNTITYSSGLINNAANLTSASTQFFTEADATSLKPATISLQVWVKYSALPSANTPNAGTWLLNKWDGSSGYILNNDASSNTGFTFYANVSGSVKSIDNVPSGGIATGVWYHVVATFDGSTMNLYVNNVAASPLSASGSIVQSTQQLQFGGNSTSATRNFSGQVDASGIWNCALSSAQVSTLFNAGAGIQYPFSTNTPASDKFIITGVQFIIKGVQLIFK